MSSSSGTCRGFCGFFCGARNNCCGIQVGEFLKLGGSEDYLIVFELKRDCKGNFKCVRYFPKRHFSKSDFPSDDFAISNFPNVQFPKRQLFKRLVRPSEAPEATTGVHESICVREGEIFVVPPLATLWPTPLKTPFLKKYCYLF